MSFKDTVSSKYSHLCVCVCVREAWCVNYAKENCGKFMLETFNVCILDLRCG